MKLYIYKLKVVKPFDVYMVFDNLMVVFFLKLHQLVTCCCLFTSWLQRGNLDLTSTLRRRSPCPASSTEWDPRPTSPSRAGSRPTPPPSTTGSRTRTTKTRWSSTASSTTYPRRGGTTTRQ